MSNEVMGVHRHAWEWGGKPTGKPTGTYLAEGKQCRCGRGESMGWGDPSVKKEASPQQQTTAKESLTSKMVTAGKGTGMTKVKKGTGICQEEISPMLSNVQQDP